MSFRRVGWVAAIAVATWFELSCGQVYRPVVIPISITPPNPANFHSVFGISANVPFNQGTALQIDVSGDSNIGIANVGVNPTHAAILPNNSRVFVASAGSMFKGDSDVVTAFFPAGDSNSASGLGTTTTFTFPSSGAGQSSSIAAISESSNLVTVTLSAPLSNALVGAMIDISGVGVSGYKGIFPISFVNGTTIQYVDSTTGLAASSGGIATVPVSCSYLPDFVATSQTNAVFVANYGSENDANCNFSSTDSVAALNTSQSTIGNIAYLPAGAHPVAMVETPDAQNLYVLNQGNNTVSNLSPQDLSIQATIPVGNTPAWAAARPDSRRVYVVTQGDGQLYTIRTDTNAVITGSPQPVGGAGANFVLYDKSLNRLYVTNPNAGNVYVFDATTDPPTPMGSATGAISVPAPPIPANTPPCGGGACSYSSAMPVSVAPLPDGTRFYVASYVTSGASCPDPNVTAAACAIPQVTVFDAGTLAVKSTVFPLLAPVTNPVSQVQPFALASTAFCVPVVPYTPASARFRMFAVAATDSSRVYASMCDGGSVAIVKMATNTISTGSNATDTLVTDLPAPFSAAAVSSGEPPPQTPVYLLTGQ
jgi:YVTN family beta-propeller protein